MWLSLKWNLAGFMRSPSGWDTPRTDGTCPACRRTASPSACRTPADPHGRALQNTHRSVSHTPTCSALAGRARRTCAAGEVGNVAVFEDLGVLQHFRQPPQTRAAHYPHRRAHLSVGAQPIRRGAALLVAATDSRQTAISTFCSAGHTCTVMLLQQENKEEPSTCVFTHQRELSLLPFNIIYTNTLVQRHRGTYVSCCTSECNSWSGFIVKTVTGCKDTSLTCISSRHTSLELSHPHSWMKHIYWSSDVTINRNPSEWVRTRCSWKLKPGMFPYL